MSVNDWTVSPALFTRRSNATTQQTAHRPPRVARVYALFLVKRLVQTALQEPATTTRRMQLIVLAARLVLRACAIDPLYRLIDAQVRSLSLSFA